MVDEEELRASSEEVCEGGGPFIGLESVLLVDPDPAIDTTRIAARIDQGVLALTLPKAESVKPRKIVVD